MSATLASLGSSYHPRPVVRPAPLPLTASPATPVKVEAATEEQIKALVYLRDRVARLQDRVNKDLNIHADRFLEFCTYTIQDIASYRSDTNRLSEPHKQFINARLDELVTAVGVKQQELLTFHDTEKRKADVFQKAQSFIHNQESRLAPLEQLLALGVRTEDEAEIAVARHVYDRINTVLTTRSEYLTKEQISYLETLQKRADDFIPETSKQKAIRILLPPLRFFRNAYTSRVNDKCDARAAYLKARKKDEAAVQRLTKGVWEKAHRPKVAHFGGNVLLGNTACKMRTDAIVQVIDSLPSKDRFEKLRSALLTDQHIARKFHEELAANSEVAPRLREQLYLYVYRETSGAVKTARVEKLAQGQAMLSGEIFVDPRVILKTINRLIDHIQPEDSDSDEPA